MIEQLSFLSESEVRRIQQDFGTPVFIYDEAYLRARAAASLAMPNAFGLSVRYAMKACPSAAILMTLVDAGLHIDASSSYEANRAITAGVPPDRIQLTGQELARDLAQLLDKGVLFNACSLHQLEAYGKLRKGGDVSIRINPGLGSGHSNRTNVGGPSASFGIWHEHLDQVSALSKKYDLHITRMHTHIGSGADPDVWNRCAQMSLAICARLPEVTSLSLGGGFKVGRMAGEPSTDLQEVGEVIRRDFEAFAAEHGRRLHMEIEPGTYMVANAGVLIATVVDVVDTGAGGFHFLKVDTGMTEVTRPSLYGAQHPLITVPLMPGDRPEVDYIVAGHCCESGDILTPEPGNPEGLAPRRMLRAYIGDPIVVGGAGAYCAGMSTKNYNSFPEAPEVMKRCDGSFSLIRKRQTLAQMVLNELPL